MVPTWRIASGKPSALTNKPRQLFNSCIEVAVKKALHEPHLGESVGHRAEPGGRDVRVQLLVGEAVALEPADGVGNLRR